MILGIDAFNIRAGGGVTHLVELLRVANPQVHGFKDVIVWGGSATLEKIDRRNWLRTVPDPLLDRGLFWRVYWQHFRLKALARNAGCDVLFVPGGSDASSFRPMVTMSQNLLPFEWREMRRYGWSLTTLKNLLLRWTQSHSFRKTDGVIYLTKYAHDAVLKVTGPQHGRTVIIPHGINPRFLLPPRLQRQSVDYTEAQPCRVLYVSKVDQYKHQWRVAEAVAQLRAAGVPIVLDLVGPSDAGMGRLETTLRRVDPGGAFINYCGAVPYEKLDASYRAADLCVFASSCENMPIILLEGMAAGLPIAGSNMGPMPEVLGDAGLYFNPEDAKDITHTLRALIEAPDLRARLARAAYERAQQFSWIRCAHETFGFLADIANNNRAR